MTEGEPNDVITAIPWYLLADEGSSGSPGEPASAQDPVAPGSGVESSPASPEQEATIPKWPQQEALEAETSPVPDSPEPRESDDEPAQIFWSVDEDASEAPTLIRYPPTFAPPAQAPPPPEPDPGAFTPLPEEGSRRSRRPSRSVLVVLAVVLAVVLVAVAGGITWVLHAGGRSGPSPAAAARSTAPSRATAASAAASPQAATPAGYKRYSNDRFAFTTLYPASFVAQPPSPNSAGLEWLAASDGNVSLRTFAWNNTKNATTDVELAWFRQTMQVTYSHTDGDVLTVSGLTDNDSTMVYIHEIVGPGSIYRLRWSYPASQKALWDDAVTATTKAFTPGDASVQH